MHIFGFIEKYLKQVVRRPYELPHIMDGPLSAPFVSFGLRMRSLRDFLTDAIKHMVFTAQDGPHPSKNGTKRPFFASLSFAVSADVINHVAFTIQNRPPAKITREWCTFFSRKPFGLRVLD